MVCVSELPRDLNTEVSVVLGIACLCCGRCVIGSFINEGRLGPASSSRHAWWSSCEGDVDVDWVWFVEGRRARRGGG
jgi:hypothetical protein